MQLKDNIMDINAIPSLLFDLYSTVRVRVTKVDGFIRVAPINDEHDCTEGLRGILASYDNMSVDNFLERMRADKEMDS